MVAYGMSVALHNTKNDVPINVSVTFDSGMPLHHPYIQKIHEANCYVTAAVFNLMPYKEPEDQDVFDATLNAGAFITLHHSEVDAFLVCRDGR